jgi:hypothetical protein
MPMLESHGAICPFYISPSFCTRLKGKKKARLESMQVHEKTSEASLPYAAFLRQFAQTASEKRGFARRDFQKERG